LFCNLRKKKNPEYISWIYESFSQYAINFLNLFVLGSGLFIYTLITLLSRSLGHKQVIVRDTDTIVLYLELAMTEFIDFVTNGKMKVTGKVFKEMIFHFVLILTVLYMLHREVKLSALIFLFLFYDKSIILKPWSNK